MAKAEVNQSVFASDLSNLPHLNGPLPPKRSRLSLRRTTQLLHKPCYKEDDSTEAKNELQKQQRGSVDKSSVEMIDLTQDENTSPNCISSLELKSASSHDTEEENQVKVWTLGLPNCGNTCFVNSILQVLRFTPDFLNSLHSLLLIHHHLSKICTEDVETKELIFFKQLHLLYIAMKRKEALMKINTEKDYSTFLLKPVKLVIDSLREVSLLFEEGEQHDAHELLLTTIAAFSTACQSLKNYIKKEAVDLFIKESSPIPDSNSKSDIKSVSSPKPDLKKETTTNYDTSAGQELKNQTSTSKRRRPKIVSLDYSVFENLNLGFEGRIRHVVQCLECEKRLEREESFANLELNIPETVDNEDDSDPDSEPRDSDTVDLCDCLSQTTILCGENKYFCEDCQHHNEARMSSEVINPPPILLLHFSWSRAKEISSAEKSTVKVMIPMTLKTSDNSEVFCCPDQNYKLFAIVLHIGRSTEGGHYVSFIKDVSQEDVQEDSDQKPMRPKVKPANQFPFEPENCCSTEEISNFSRTTALAKWLLFDDSVVLSVIIDENSETFPYYNYLSITASPCMIFYHKT
ncbi:ubiquitin carboxyl-terminal hydrolase 1-like [Argiope bruennichi]|uniref:Ubiquitin carboxyl-terminal hydrolase n=1 Tax=Argiope bruennichi TaxID=94029 RepID=A0A8T0DY20_ARGBR|nr:ubiquitin carboxyl-terminal hydrolase 1-like [Argiope bruennichi]KAF8763382.1 Ubiquitin carboxyl-terminal hydrolase 3 like protein [Argiope bruennichi]